MQGLIEDLLVYSRVRTRGAFWCRPIRRARLTRQCENLRVAVQESGAELRVRVEVTVLADESQLTQLFQNLLSNSLKFRGPTPPQISVTARREGDHCVFAVRDNGIGILPKYSERIFQMFERLHTRDEYAGTGIGLALCKRIETATAGGSG